MIFTFKNPKTNEVKTVEIPDNEVREFMEYEALDKLGESICRCQPIGETNVVECGCDAYIDDFELVKGG